MTPGAFLTITCVALVVAFAVLMLAEAVAGWWRR